MDKKIICKLAGGQKKLAQLLNISQAAISQWTVIPMARQWQLQLLKPEWFTENEI